MSRKVTFRHFPFEYKS